jgi:hypothetical protein
MKPSVADKPAAKSAQKVFDVARPGKGTPSATSRPVLISNRPMLQDPMVSSQQAPADKPSIAAKVTIKPIAEAKAESKVEIAEPSESEKTSPSMKDKTIAELAAEKSTDKPEVDASTHAAENKESDAASEDDAEATHSVEDSKAEPEEEATKQTSEPETSTDDAGKPVDDALLVEESKDAKETAALEADAKKQEEITALAESREYFLPINALERRRSKIVLLLGVVLIVALGLLLLDLLLDVGFVRINGLRPLTHFFSA